MRLMPVSIPDQVLLSRDDQATTVKLAVNVASLFGVRLSASVQPQTWVCRFDALTLKQLGAGSPNDFTRSISSATLNKFVPDRKAAAVLTGAELLFEPLVGVFSDVLQTIGGDLSDEIRVAIWAVLVHETYRSQPALFAAAVVARGVQRALTKDWAPYVGPEILTTEPEFVSDVDEVKSDLSPRTLNVLDETVSSVAHLSFAGLHRGSQRYLRDDLINRWMKHLLKSDDRGLAWIVDDNGHRWVDTFTPLLAPVVSLIDEFQGSAATPGVRDSTSWPLYLPRIPSAAALMRLNETARGATIWAILQVHRILRENPRFDDTATGRAFYRQVTADAEELAELSSDVLGAGHPLSVWTRAKWLNKVISDERDISPSGALAHLDLLKNEISHMTALHDTGAVTPGQLADFLSSLSAIINALSDDAEDRHDSTTAKEIKTFVIDMWERIFSSLPFDARQTVAEEVPSPHRQRTSRLMSSYLHNYATVIARGGSKEHQQSALKLETSIVVPARRSISTADTKLRNALQLVVWILVRQAEAAEDAAERRRLADHAWPVVEELLTSDFGRQLAEPTGEDHEIPLRSEQINSITAITAGLILALEHGIRHTLANPDLAQRLLDRAEVTLRRIADPSDPKSSGRLLQVIAQRERLDAVRKDLA